VDDVGLGVFAPRRIPSRARGRSRGGAAVPIRELLTRPQRSNPMLPIEFNIVLFAVAVTAFVVWATRNKWS
jgi:hypothetical protein